MVRAVLDEKGVPKAPSDDAPEAPETRRVVTWPEGRPLEWRIEEVIVEAPEPAWAARARELRAAGWSIRRIMKDVGVKSRRFLCEILDKYPV